MEGTAEGEEDSREEDPLDQLQAIINPEEPKPSSQTATATTKRGRSPAAVLEPPEESAEEDWKPEDAVPVRPAKRKRRRALVLDSSDEDEDSAAASRKRPPRPAAAPPTPSAAEEISTIAPRPSSRSSLSRRLAASRGASLIAKMKAHSRCLFRRHHPRSLVLTLDFLGLIFCTSLVIPGCAWLVGMDCCPPQPSA